MFSSSFFSSGWIDVPCNQVDLLYLYGMYIIREVSLKGVGSRITEVAECQT